MKKAHPRTPDGRYFTSKGKLWRCTDPRLSDSDRRRLIKTMMQGRVAMKDAGTEEDASSARRVIDAAKIALGEMGPVWWDDGAPDFSGRRPEDTTYATWWAVVAREGDDTT